MNIEEKVSEFNSDAERLMKKAYETMLTSQGNFSNIAVSRAIEVSKDNGINLDQSQILGVSFMPAFAVVAILYKPIIVGPDNNGEPRQIQIPVPVECMFIQNDSWKEIYQDILQKSKEAIDKDKASGEISKAFNGETSN